MKLRIRHLESKETFRIEVPDSCTVQQLKSAICSRIVPPPPDDGLFISLNRNDDLSGSSLRSLGVTSGDLIFYSVTIPNSDAALSFSYQSVDPRVDDSVKSIAQEVELAEAADVKPMDLDAGARSTANSVDACKIETQFSNAHGGETGTLTLAGSSSGLYSSRGYENSDEGEFQDMDVVKEDMLEDESLMIGKSSFSVPTFLRKVFDYEVDGISNGNGCNDHRLLVVAVHAALLESGFVGYDLPSKTKVAGFRFPDKWPYRALYYTIPEALPSDSEAVETVIVKFQCLGKFLNVIGSSSKKNYLHRISLDASRLIPALEFIWGNGDSTESQSQRGFLEEMKAEVEKTVFELWKTVKDGLALPLLIDLCENAGFPLPSCFTQLPIELKIKILETLPGVDTAKVACVCSELRFLASNNDLWRQKYHEEFGVPTDVSLRSRMEWKAMFGKSWERRRRAKFPYGSYEQRRIGRRPIWMTNPFGPFPFGGSLYDEIPRSFVTPSYFPRLSSNYFAGHF